VQRLGVILAKNVGGVQGCLQYFDMAVSNFYNDMAGNITALDEYHFGSLGYAFQSNYYN